MKRQTQTTWFDFISNRNVNTKAEYVKAFNQFCMISSKIMILAYGSFLPQGHHLNSVLQNQSKIESLSITQSSNQQSLLILPISHGNQLPFSLSKFQEQGSPLNWSTQTQIKRKEEDSSNYMPNAAFIATYRETKAISFTYNSNSYDSEGDQYAEKIFGSGVVRRGVIAALISDAYKTQELSLRSGCSEVIFETYRPTSVSTVTAQKSATSLPLSEGETLHAIRKKP